MKPHVRKIVDRSSAVAAGVGVVLSPFPFVDEAVMLPLLGAMTVGIGHQHGLGWKQVPWKPVARTAVGGLVARATVNLGVTYVPIVAGIANAVSAAALAEAFGAYADRVCADPDQAHTETLEELKVDMNDLAHRWRRLCSRSKPADEHSAEGARKMNANTATNGAAVPPAQEIRSSIERSLHTRHFGRDQVLFKVEDAAKGVGTKAWELMKKRPYAGVAAISAAGFAIASAVGVGELAVAVVFGYAAFEVLRRGKPVGESVEEIVKDVGHMA